MDFAITLQTDPPASRIVELAQRAERAGFSTVWLFDSHILWQEPYVIFAAILAATEHIRVGPLVTNPTTRDPTVTASLFATLNDMFGNRTVCAIGRGDSSRRVLGGSPASLRDVARAVEVIRELAAGRTIDTPAGEVRIPWVRDGELEVWMAGYGPKALATVGRCADGFVLQLADPVLLEWTLGRVRAAAAENGRDPGELAVCVSAPAYVSGDLAHARDQCRWFGGMVGNHVADLVARYGPEGEIPTALTDYIRAREGYDYAHHGRVGNPDTAFVPDEIVERFCILGEVEQHLAKIAELERRGMTQCNLYLMHDAITPTLEAYGEHIIPRLGSPVRS
ncbi:MAG TPA: TIGR03842 family LLM class F420-dependent oxidoreductase [Solirubrobacteraceae bacterium]|nr:TIGR03842 family LLM class F420-dependent oxidoreductase [Solirubrobacteraceae bacterium]